MSDNTKQFSASASQEDDTWGLLCYLVDALPIVLVPFVIQDIAEKYPGHEILKALEARQNEDFFSKG